MGAAGQGKEGVVALRLHEPVTDDMRFAEDTTLVPPHALAIPSLPSLAAATPSSIRVPPPRPRRLVHSHQLLRLPWDLGM